MTLRTNPMAVLAALLLATTVLPTPPDGVLRLARRALSAVRAPRTAPVLFPDSHEHSAVSGLTLSMERD